MKPFANPKNLAEVMNKHAVVSVSTNTSMGEQLAARVCEAHPAILEEIGIDQLCVLMRRGAILATNTIDDISANAVITNNKQ